MQGETRWHVVPKSVGTAVLSLVAGVLLLCGVVWQMADAGEVAVLPLLAAIASVALIAVAVLGLVRPKARGR